MNPQCGKAEAICDIYRILNEGLWKDFDTEKQRQNKETDETSSLMLSNAATAGEQ
jgi:hypothetical protein